MKMCPDCGVEKELTEFCLVRAGEDKRRTYCRSCTKVRHDATHSRLQYVVVDKKVCRACRETKTPEHFTSDKRKKDGLGSYCRPCVRDRHLRAKYGVDAAELSVMMDSGCGICGSLDSLVVDHDHSCCPGVFTCGRCLRGVLCASCNKGVGFLGDTLARLEAAVLYLRRTPLS